MLSLWRNGIPFLLPAEASAQVDHKNPLLSDTLEDSYAPELDVPTRGNEELLEHVHELPLAERTTTLTGGQLGHGGAPIAPCTLHVLNTTPANARVSVMLQGFVEHIKGVTLEDALRGELIDMLAEELYDFHNLPRYAQGGRMQFPMHRNPSLYSKEARPRWNPSASEWSATQAYQVNALVTYTEWGTVRRDDVWQCTVDTSAGESPETHPSKWRRTAFALVNAWDRAEGMHYLNTEESPFYALCPWFYYKWVVKRALAHVGFTPVGDWMDDTANDEWLMPYTTTIDARNEQTSLYFFKAQQTAATSYNGNFLDFRVPGHNDSTSGNQDPDGVWDNSAMDWECPAAGVYVLRATTTMNRVGVWQIGRTPKVRAILVDDSGALRGLQMLQNLAAGDQTRTAEFTFTCAAGDVGRKFSIIMLQVETWTVSGMAQSNTTWPTAASDTYQNSEVRGWKSADAPAVCVPDMVIRPHRHVPPVDLGGWLQAIADAFNLELVPDFDTRTLRMDYRETVLRKPEANTTEQSHRVVGPVEVDHQRSTTGVRLKWDMETSEDPAELLENAETAYSVQDLPAATTTGQYAVLRGTRQLLKSVFNATTAQFHWQHTGHHVPSKLVGDEAEAVERTPALVPLHMVQENLDGKEYLVPLLDAEGTSAWYHTNGRPDTVWICMYAPQRSSDGSVANVPGARSWGWGWNADDRALATLLWDDDDPLLPGLYQRLWRLWLALLTTAEPVTMDLLVDLEFMAHDWRRLLLMHSQRYLVETLPVDYGPVQRHPVHGTNLLSRGAYLLRVKDLVAPSAPVLPVFTDFACVGPGYHSFTALEEQSLEAITDTGYATLRRASDGTVTTYGDGNPATPINVPYEVGAHCLWASDEEGVMAGNIEWLQHGSGSSAFDVSGLSALQVLMCNLFDIPCDLRGLELLASVTLIAGTCTEVLLEDNYVLAEVLAPNNAITNTDAIINAIDASLGAIINIDLRFGTNAARTSASDTNYNAIIAAGGTVLTN